MEAVIFADTKTKTSRRRLAARADRSMLAVRCLTFFLLGLAAWWLSLVLPAAAACAAEPVAKLRVSLAVDFGDDRGQNFGSLFEIDDEQGHARIGAGFMGAYNTQPRSNRRTLHFYVKPADDRFDFRLSTLPKPTTDCGVYLYDFQSRLYGRSRNGSDPLLRYWDRQANAWRIDRETPPYASAIADGILAVAPQQITWNGRAIYRVTQDRISLGEYYYANGFIFVRLYDKQSEPWVNRIAAVRWSAAQPTHFNLDQAVVLELRSANEFVYACGQLGDKVIVSTNTGGNYDFDGRRWRTLIEPNTTTSFQVYSILNFRDRLLMGQYPTGNVFEYDGDAMRLRENWPPAMPGVVDRAREAQTLAIYRGDVYCGVWPWGEVWRLDPADSRWRLVGRMFDHPEVSTRVRHPYEKEMGAFDQSLNRWGQRVTSMIPLGDSLYVGTSAKTSAPFEPRFDFLAGGQWKDYGKVHRLTAAGHLSVSTRWTGRRRVSSFRSTASR